MNNNKCEINNHLSSFFHKNQANSRRWWGLSSDSNLNSKQREAETNLQFFKKQILKQSVQLLYQTSNNLLPDSERVSLTWDSFADAEIITGLLADAKVIAGLFTDTEVVSRGR